MTGAKGGLPEPKRVAEITPEHLVKGMLNVVIFGPGRGEAILLMLPDGSVGIVDGCGEPRSKDGRGDPVRELLAHLERERQDSELSLRFVCLTHPHDDHYGGLGRLLQAYEGRVDEVWCPFQTGDHYIDAYRSWLDHCKEPAEQPDRDSLRGLDRAFHEMRRRHTDTAPKPRIFKQGTPLLNSRRRMDGAVLRIFGVGPSDADIQDAQDALVATLSALTSGTRRSLFDPNDASGALLVRWGKAQVLLAGDLTRGRDALHGWQCTQSDIRDRVQVVNVAHHASAGAHYVDLWAKMKPALAIVTPFQGASNNQPPRPADIDRLLDSNADVVITARPKWVESQDDTGTALPVPVGGGLQPQSLQAPSRGRRAPGNGILSTVPAPGFDARRNAAAVALDRHGTIHQLVLAGEADLYRHSRTRDEDAAP